MEVLADSEKFPENWLFKHRWGKGKKNHSSVLPNGDKITFLTVGGRTSAIVPSVQKKSGAVGKDEDDEESNGTKTQAKRKRSTKKEESDSEPEDKGKAQKSEAKKQNKDPVKKEEGEESKETIETESSGKRRSTRSRK